jgi:hypothetical protein
MVFSTSFEILSKNLKKSHQSIKFPPRYLICGLWLSTTVGNNCYVWHCIASHTWICFRTKCSHTSYTLFTELALPLHRLSTACLCYVSSDFPHCTCYFGFTKWLCICGFATSFGLSLCFLTHSPDDPLGFSAIDNGLLIKNILSFLILYLLVLTSMFHSLGTQHSSVSASSSSVFHLDECLIPILASVLSFVSCLRTIQLSII